MKTYTFVALLALSLSACNGVNHVLGNTGNRPPADTSLPDDYTVTGTTVIDYQVIQPIRVVNSTVTVWVKRKDQTMFMELNRYEYYPDPEGTGGGGVWLRGRVEVNNGIPNFLHLPVAPVGSEYKIRSVLNS